MYHPVEQFEQKFEQKIEVFDELAGCFEWLFRMPGYSHDDHDDFDDAFQCLFRKPDWATEDIDTLANAFKRLCRINNYHDDYDDYSDTFQWLFRITSNSNNGSDNLDSHTLRDVAISALYQNVSINMPAYARPTRESVRRRLEF